MMNLFADYAIPTVDGVFQLHDRIDRASKNQIERERKASAPLPDGIFFGMTPDEVNYFFVRLEHLAMVDLLATAEAHLKRDFERRVANKRKDPLSRQFRQVKHNGNAVRLVDDILNNWKKHHPSHKIPVNDLPQHLAALPQNSWYDSDVSLFRSRGPLPCRESGWQ